MRNFFHERLFGMTKTGKIKWWQISVTSENPRIAIIEIVHASNIGAKAVTSIEHITSGKNIGKANETTPLSQAIFNARSKVNKQLDKGYVEDKNLLNPNIGLLNTFRHPRPMLAEPIKLLKDKDIKGKMYVQPKLDGHRCTTTFDLENAESFDSVFMYSRAGKAITSMPQIAKDLKKQVGPNEYIDGELYKHDSSNLQTLSSLIKREQEGSTTLQYWVYDTLTTNESQPFSERFKRLQEIEGDNIVITPTYEVNSMEEAMEYFVEFRNQGFEGAILRLDGYKYEAGFRSRQLLKMKKFFDAEFVVLGITAGKPRYKEDGEVLQVAILHMQDPNDVSVDFTVTAPGDMYEKDEIFRNGTSYIGKILTVQYSMKTSDNVPFHPTAVRWYESL